MKTSPKGFIAPLILIIIALVVLGGGAYVYTQNKQANPPANENVALPQATSTIPVTNQKTSTQQVPDSQTADWKTYTNTKYGFEFKFSPELKGNTSGDGFAGSVSGNSVNLMVTVIDKDSAPVPNMPSRSIIVASVKSVEYYSNENKVIYIPISANKQIKIDAELPYADLDRILPTFKFTSSSQTTDWKTNDNLVYSFKYPQDLVFQSLNSSFVDVILGQEADIPVSYNLPNSFQRSQKIYVGINGAKSKEACMPTQPTSSTQYSVFIAPIAVDGFVFNKFQTGGDCAMDGCSIGNTYTIWSGDNNCYEVSWFAIQSSYAKYYQIHSSDPYNDPGYLAAKKDAQTTTKKISTLTEQILSTFRFHP
jgi:hypothetical protein